MTPGIKLETNFRCALPTGSSIAVQFDPSSNIIYGFQDFFTQTEICVDDVTVVRTSERSRLEVQVFRKNGISLDCAGNPCHTLHDDMCAQFTDFEAEVPDCTQVRGTSNLQGMMICVMW